jgi:CheY-like chemotaxis protein
LGLQGNLEDLPLLDIIQIVSFSKKTGYLSIEMEEGEGAIVFREGLVVSAFTATSPPPDARLGTLPAEAREKAARQRIGFALEQLARLREGAFSFELADEVPSRVGGRDISLERLSRGINPQEMLLDLAEGIDEDRAQSTAAVEASFAAPEEAVVADSEDLVVVEPLAEQDERPPAEPVPPEEAWKDTRPSRPGTDTQPFPAVAAKAAPPAGSAPRVDAAPAPAAPPETPAPPTAAEPPAAGPSAGEPSAGEPSASADARTLLLVDDEDDVRGILARHFASAGFRIEEAGDPEAAAKAAGRLREAGEAFVLVTDLGMPASGGASFHGGFEVVKRLWKMNLRPPVLMMTESLNQSLRLRARQMGIQAFVFKPTLSKLNPRQFEADLSAFAAKLGADVIPRLAESAALRVAAQPRRPPEARPVEGAPPAADATRPFEFLRRRLVELRQGGDANQIAVLVMKVAREFFERAILFVVKNDEARGLGGFGLAPREEALNLLARQITIPLAEPSVFRSVVQERRGFHGSPPPDRWAGHLMGRVGRFQSRGVALLPLVAHRETIALLFGDNPETGREPSGLEALEVFVQQAGIALENVFLQRKLQTIEEKDRAGLR